MIDKPYSQACENNKVPILQVFKSVITQATTVWEIGSGTGQHGCYFAEQLPHIIWQPTDRMENISGISMWRNEAQLVNLNTPICLDVTDTVWPCNAIEVLFTANTLHIMSMETVRIFFERLAVYVTANALLCIYGPFNYNGTYTSDSNARFDQWLKSRDSLSGIKNVEDIMRMASASGFSVQHDVSMPANNRLLVLRRQ